METRVVEARLAVETIFPGVRTTMTTQETLLREQLTALLKGGQAHATLAEALANFPEDRAGDKPNGLPYSAWQLLEHIRVTLHDLLDFSTNSDYVELNWPDDYWPNGASPRDGESWHASVAAVEADLKEFARLVHSPKSNLYATIPWGKNNETLLREVLLAADHTSYHVGELILLRKMIGLWKK
jgi:DinB superfamily